MQKNDVKRLRKQIFSQEWPLDAEITAIAGDLPSHEFLHNPSGQYAYIYLSQFIKALASQQLQKGFDQLSVLDWGCGKGHVSKIIRDLGPQSIDSCDILSEKNDSTFGQETPIIQRCGITVRPLEHQYKLPYDDASFHIVLSFGVLEHVQDDNASLDEIQRILKPGGLFFCFFLPTRLSWTQMLVRNQGDHYHDRLYTRDSVNQLLKHNRMDALDIWYRQIFPKNRVHYPNFRLFEELDQKITEYTPLRYFATNIEFVARKHLASD
ncbi:MAG TPA: class I SAM-dependent methyltransferase [Edaphobacter sp.]